MAICCRKINKKAGGRLVWSMDYTNTWQPKRSASNWMQTEPVWRKNNCGPWNRRIPVKVSSAFRRQLDIYFKLIPQMNCVSDRSYEIGKIRRRSRRLLSENISCHKMYSFFIYGIRCDARSDGWWSKNQTIFFMISVTWLMSRPIYAIPQRDTST